MEKIVSTSEQKRVAYLKAKEASDAIALKLKEFGYEMRADGNVTAMGRMRKHSAATRTSVLAAVSSGFRALITSIVTDDVIRTNLENARAFLIATQNMLRSTSAIALSPAFAAEETLSQVFTRNVAVSEEVHAALHAEVEEFELIQNRIASAKNPEFIGPFKEPELNAMRNGVVVCGPLACEFHAYTALNAKGIEYDTESNAFIFPEKMVSAFAKQFGEATTPAQNTKEVLVAFKEAATIDKTQQVISLNTANRPHGPNATLEPAPVYVVQ